MTLTYEAASRELTALYGNGGRISAGVLAAIGSLSDANEPGGIEGQIAHLIACVIDDVKMHDGKLGPRTILAEDRLKVLVRLAVNKSAPQVQLSDPVAEVGDPRVRAVYAILCSGEVQPAHEQRESWLSRQIVDALAASKTGSEAFDAAWLMSVVRSVQPGAVRIPPGIREIATAIFESFAAQCAESAARVCDGVVEQSNNHLFRSGAKICAGEIRKAIK